MHAGLGYMGIATLGAHYVMAWTQDDRASQGTTPDGSIGVLAADLKLSMWNLDDGLRPIRGVPAAVLVRDNGLDVRASAMLDAVKAFRPNLVRP